MLKLSKVGFEKWLPWQRFNWYGHNQHTIVFPDKFYEKSPNFVAVAAFVSKIRIFEISAGTLCPFSRCKIGPNCRQYCRYSNSYEFYKNLSWLVWGGGWRY